MYKGNRKIFLTPQLNQVLTRLVFFKVNPGQEFP